nr:uncharacterized protein LOC108190753 [Danio rerio]|eukprot:XP_017212688.1 uncharacterized protein LOC108190753 [Danio rerio]
MNLIHPHWFATVELAIYLSDLSFGDGLSTFLHLSQGLQEGWTQLQEQLLVVPNAKAASSSKAQRTGARFGQASFMPTPGYHGAWVQQRKVLARSRGRTSLPPVFEIFTENRFSPLRESAKPVVKVNPDQPVFIGETVTLTCDTQTGENTQWIKYSWIKNSSPAPGIGERVYEITSVSDADAGQYSCELSDISSQTSVISAAVTLTVSERPKPVVNVSPDQRVFIGETVTLTCDIQTGGNIQWTKYSWIKDGDTRYQYYPQTKPSTVDWSFRADSVYFGGQYSCRGERSDSQTSDISDAVTLTVSGEAL